MFLHCLFLRGAGHVSGVSARRMMGVEGHSVGPYSEGCTNMQIKRLAAVVLTTAALTVAGLGTAGSAQALDTSWGCGGHCSSSR